jgi:hypothetical protein
MERTLIGQQARDYRYERKFLVDQMDVHQVSMLVKLHPGMFYEPYPPRFVNNLYLDTIGLENYLDNVSGTMDRQKVRIRWYGDLFVGINDPILEFKIKRGLVGTKIQYPFAPFSLDDGFSNRIYLETLKESHLPNQVMHRMRDFNVVLLNRYYRRYYASKDGKFRITLDTGMEFYGVRRLVNAFIHRSADHTHIVVELKYKKGLDQQAQKISGYFPFPVTKNSKYVQGIERVYF